MTWSITMADMRREGFEEGLTTGLEQGRVRSGQQFTAERAAERNADCVNIACR